MARPLFSVFLCGGRKHKDKQKKVVWPCETISNELEAFFLNFSNGTTPNKSKDTNYMLIPSESKGKLSEHVLLIYLISAGARIYTTVWTILEDDWL